MAEELEVRSVHADFSATPPAHYSGPVQVFTKRGVIAMRWQLSARDAGLAGLEVGEDLDLETLRRALARALGEGLVPLEDGQRVTVTSDHFRWAMDHPPEGQTRAAGKGVKVGWNAEETFATVQIDYPNVDLPASRIPAEYLWCELRNGAASIFVAILGGDSSARRIAWLLDVRMGLEDFTREILNVESFYAGTVQHANGLGWALADRLDANPAALPVEERKTTWATSLVVSRQGDVGEMIFYYLSPASLNWARKPGAGPEAIQVSSVAQVAMPLGELLRFIASAKGVAEEALGHLGRRK